MTLYAGITLRNGRYSVQQPLGEGGMGSAYLADDLDLGRKCVIKEAHIADSRNKERFEQEARLLAALPKHPNLPIVYEWFIENDHPYIVLEYVEGASLDRLAQTRSESFGVQEVLRWTEDLLEALKHIHQHGILHRDIKPQNVCITPEGNAVLLDFGISRRMEDTHTKTLDQAVSQGYAPIEQYPEAALKHMPSPLKYVQNLHADDIRTGPYSDLYSLSATLYFALTSISPPDACMRVLDDELRSVRHLNSNVPIYLAEILTKALALHPQRRFQSASEMLTALQNSRGPQLCGVVHRQTFRPPVESITLLGHEFVPIPAGSFIMGSDDPELKDACHPRHNITLHAYYISRYPVTHADYQRFIKDNPDYPVPYSHMRFAESYNWDTHTRTVPKSLGNHPVVLVTWMDAVAYCRWLSSISGRRCRLASEAEWEKAAAWDPENQESLCYPWGNIFDKTRCNVDVDGMSELGTLPVGQYSPSGDSTYGVGDMAGNVWEWTGSLFAPYPYQADTGREDTEVDGPRVARGGSYRQGPLLAQTAWREAISPQQRLPDLGFRVVCEIQ